MHAILLKNSDDIPQRMKPTKRSMVLESIVCVSGLIAFLIFVFDHDNTFLEYTFGLIFVLVSFIAAYYEMDFNAFKLSMKSFRGFVILISTLLTISSDISRNLLCDSNDQPLLSTIIDDMIWISSIIMLISADSAPRLTNYIRLIGPFCVLCANIYSMISMSIWLDCDYIIFTISHGSLTSLDVELACKMNILLYGCTFLWGVPKDYKHEYFVLLDNKILIKQLLPFRDVATQKTSVFCFKIDTIWIFHLISICGCLFALSYVIVVATVDPQDNNVPLMLIIFNIILLVIIIILTTILICKYFQIYMIKQLILQFRANILIITIISMFYLWIQKLIWHKIDIHFIIQTSLNKISFIIVCVLALFRDAMNLSYPRYFVTLFGLLLMSLSLFNVYQLEFGFLSILYPKWFTAIEKQAYYQVFAIAYLFVYYLHVDKEDKYFALIRKRKKTKELWCDINTERNNDDEHLTEYLFKHDENTNDML